jgi:DNA helicase-2/ATP-dependent DNA helicase PcrA
MEPADLLVDLDEGQRRAVTSPATPLAILAPAGSGKTRVLTRRIAHRVATGDADPGHILALTFTRKAAGELIRRLRRLGLRGDVSAGTFHAVAYAQLRTRWQDQGRQAPALLARKGRVLAPLLPRTRGGATAGDLATEIEWAQARLIGPEGYVDAAAAASRRPALAPAAVAEAYARYEEHKRTARLVDFDDLLGLCLQALEQDQVFASTQRWRFRHLFVDEFQDVNPLQFRLLEAWRGDHYDLCVVGDPQQAIYGWNGADAGFLLDIQRHYPPVEVIRLDRSYRSSPQVLAAAASALRRARQPVQHIEPTRPDGPMPTVTSHETDREEATAIARAVRDQHAPGVPWGAQAVLVRTHAQTTLIVEALRAAGIPTRVRGGGDFLDRPEVRRALRTLREASTPLATALIDLAAILDEDDENGIADAERDAVAEERLNVEMLVRLGHDFLRLAPNASPAGFSAWLAATVLSEGPDDTGDAVDIATFHAAKGLEWSVVHLAGVEDGFVPISHARTPAAKAEEARLLYVAMTRAERSLHCTWSRTRAFGTKTVDRRLSPLLQEVADQQIQDQARPTGPAEDWRQRPAEQRALIASTTSPRPAALEALRRWRDTAARAARIDPATLVGDRLLEEVAARRPADHTGLLAIEGMGPILVSRFGDAMLAALAERADA